MNLKKLRKMTNHEMFVDLSNEDLIALLDLIDLQHEAVKGYALTVANNQCVDYHVCCGVATDLSHDRQCQAQLAILAYDKLNQEEA